MIFISVFNFLFEFYSFVKNEIKFQIKFSKLILSILILVLSLVFVFYFTNTIIGFQDLGEQATNSTEFADIHNASEVVIKIILIMQFFLYFLSFKTEKNDTIFCKSNTKKE